MLLCSAKSDFDGSFAPELRITCAVSAPASPSDGRAVATAHCSLLHRALRCDRRNNLTVGYQVEM